MRLLKQILCYIFYLCNSFKIIKSNFSSSPSSLLKTPGDPTEDFLGNLTNHILALYYILTITSSTRLYYERTTKCKYILLYFSLLTNSTVVYSRLPIVPAENAL